MSSLKSRGLYSLVDWNMERKLPCSDWRVEAYTASWIEMSLSWYYAPTNRSRLIQPRGLKYVIYLAWLLVLRRGLYSLVDWNLIWKTISVSYCVSRLIQPRGLKYHMHLLFLMGDCVEAYTASWIEIYRREWKRWFQWSRLIQPRGLKCDVGTKASGKGGSRLIQPRGLKYATTTSLSAPILSRLIQPRGLKL